MNSDDARRVRNTGTELKTIFQNKYCHNEQLKDKIKLIQIIPKDQVNSILIKSGKNWQFRLGKIEEIENEILNISTDGKTILYKDNEILKQSILTRDFLKKYAFHCALLAARHRTTWQVYKSQDILNLLLDHCTVRILKTGRIKFDYHYNQSTYKGIMTIEFRPEIHKKNWVFGAHGGNSGERLRQIFEQELLYTELEV